MHGQPLHALTGKPVDVVNIPTKSGMSVGLLLVSVELFFMICILVFLKDMAGPCFIGFAIGESLGASALRIAAVSSRRSLISVPTS